MTRRMIHPQEAQTLRFPFVAVPDDDGYAILFPDLPTVTGYSETAEGIAAEVALCLHETFAAIADSGMLAPAPGDYFGLDAIPLNDRVDPVRT